MVEVIVHRHWSHSKSGKRILIRAHKMRINPTVHEHHEKRLDEEIESLRAKKREAMA